MLSNLKTRSLPLVVVAVLRIPGEAKMQVQPIDWPFPLLVLQSAGMTMVTIVMNLMRAQFVD